MPKMCVFSLTSPLSIGAVRDYKVLDECLPSFLADASVQVKLGFQVRVKGFEGVVCVGYVEIGVVVPSPQPRHVASEAK